MQTPYSGSWADQDGAAEQDAYAEFWTCVEDREPADDLVTVGATADAYEEFAAYADVD